MQIGPITAEPVYLSFAGQTRPFIMSVSRVSSGAAGDAVRDPLERRRMADRTLLCGVISPEASAHPSQHNGAVVSVPGLTTTGIDPPLLSSSVSV